MYTYSDLMRDVAYYKSMGLLTGTIGKSVLGREIPFIHTGTIRGRQIIIQAAIHGREYATAEIAMRQLRYYTKNMLGGFGIFWIPISNPDGVELCQHGLDSVDDPDLRQDLLVWNGGSADFVYWKANAHAVDINTNFPANWGTGASNATTPGASDYIGPYPASEPETQSLMCFTNGNPPIATMSYHSRGREIYYEFFQSTAELARDRQIADALGESADYAVVGSLASAGGYKDWCIQHLQIPSFTIEFFPPELAYPIEQQFIDIEYERTRQLPATLMRSLAEVFF